MHRHGAQVTLISHHGELTLRAFVHELNRDRLSTAP